MAYKNEADKKAYYERNKEKIKARSKAYYHANAEAKRLASSMWRKEHREQVALEKRVAFMRSQYGLEIEEYLKMYETQMGRCQLCEIPEADMGHRMCVDHCHETGKVRGLLCKRCNAGLGQFKDNPDLLVKAAEYLKRNK